MPAYRTPRFGYLTALGLGSLLVLAGARAEQVPPPTPPPAQPGEAVPPQAAGIKLAFKQAAGQVQRFRGDIKGDMVVSSTQGGGFELPLTLVWQFVTTEKVVGLRQGTATLSLKMDSMTLTTDAGVAKIVNKLQNGKFVTTVNGEKAQPGSPFTTNAAALNKLLAPKTIRRTSRGLILGTSIVSGNSMGGSTLSVLQLPENPVQVQDTWETTQAVALDLPAAGGAPAAKGEREVRLTHTLREIKTDKGRKFAIIDSTGSTSVDGAEAASLNQNIVGASRFDIARGALVSAQYALSINSSGASAGGAGRLDANLNVTLTEAAPAAGKPAKPAKKK